MAAAVSAIGLVSSVMGIWSFSGDNFFAAKDKDVTKIRIGAGLDSDDGLSEAGGQIWDAMVYNENGDEIGRAKHPIHDKHDLAAEIGSGDYEDIEIDQYEGNQAVRAKIWAANDAICVAYVTTTLHDGQKWAWTGDWGKICGGLVGFPSGIKLKTEDGETKEPRCMWLDGNMDGKKEAQGMAIYWPAFSSENTDPEDGEKLCGEEEGFKAWGDGKQLARRGQGNNFSRNVRRNRINGRDYPARMDDRLVVSSLADQNATEVCEDEYNYGPDFVSLSNNMYCDMETRTTLPLCGTDSDDGNDCFDLDAAEGKGKAKRDLGVVGRAVHRTVTKVVEFGKREDSNNNVPRDKKTGKVVHW